MDDGISINIATTALTALGSGGLGALLMHIFGKRPAGKICTDCPEHQRLEERVLELEKNDAKQTALLQSIDERLKTLNTFFMEYLGKVYK